MSAAILHAGAIVQCSHAPGTADPSMSDQRVKVSGQNVITTAHLYSISKCGLSTTSTPPCATGQFTKGAKHVRVGGAAVATMESQSTCVPTGHPLKPSSAQTRVRAT